jgi:membrane protein required for beta-lactamase induction
MAFLSIIIALLLERITPQLINYRSFDRLGDFSSWLQDTLKVSQLGPWLGLVVLLLPLVVAIWFAAGLFENAVFGLFELAFNVVVVFYCLGPRELDSEIDAYIDAVEVGDKEQCSSLARQIHDQESASDFAGQVAQVCKGLFSEANSRIYAVVFWFVVLGPVAAVVYRVLEQFYRGAHLGQDFAAQRQISRDLLGWIDWIPARISLFAFMISGHFEASLQAYRRGSLASVDTYEQNQDLLQQVGYAAIAAESADSTDLAVVMIRRARGLILRSLLVWLLLILVIELIS